MNDRIYVETPVLPRRDSLANTGTESAPANATTDATTDTDPSTPNPATFAPSARGDSD
ncbi:MAG: hypothetical protein ABFR90_06815 [Planctomycetota bacterium]